MTVQGCAAACLVGVQDKTGKGAVFVIISSMSFAAIEFDIDLVSRVQMQHGTVAGVVIVLVCILSYSTGSNLVKRERERPRVPVTSTEIGLSRKVHIYLRGKGKQQWCVKWIDSNFKLPSGRLRRH